MRKVEQERDRQILEGRLRERKEREKRIRENIDGKRL